MIREAPIRLARLVGAPIVHANVVGSGWSKDGREGKPPMLGRGMGDSQIVDAHGTVLVRRSHTEGEGLVVAKVQVGRVRPDDEIPADATWTPDCSSSLIDSWRREGASGRDYYLKTARPHRNKNRNTN